MKTITLNNVLPAVFADTPPASGVWLQRVTFEAGRAYQVASASGSGKSTLCAYLYGYRSDYTGCITFDGTDVRTLDIDRWCALRARHVAYVPQDLRLFATLTATENCLVKNSLTGHKSEREIRDMLVAVGLEDRLHQPAGRLSIGQQQRVAIVRALCQPFDFIVLDEPVSHLDPDTNAAVSALIARECDKQGAAIVCTSVGNPPAIEFDNILHL